MKYTGELNGSGLMNDMAYKVWYKINMKGLLFTECQREKATNGTKLQRKKKNLSIILLGLASK